jgi:hypothetical protein
MARKVSAGVSMKRTTPVQYQRSGATILSRRSEGASAIKTESKIIDKMNYEMFRHLDGIYSPLRCARRCN